MQVCLVSPPSITELRDTSLSAPEAAALRVQSAPLGILTLASALERSGHAPVAIDLNRVLYEYLHPSDSQRVSFASHVVSELCATGANVFGFSTMWSTYPFTIRVAQALKVERPDAVIVFGGPQASVVDEATLKQFPWIDAVVRGEGDETFPRFVQSLEDHRTFGAVPGLSYRSGPEVVRNTDATLLTDLDLLPPPAFHLFEDLRAGAYVPIELGRGCPFACTFCSTSSFFSRRFRVKSPGRVLQEMQSLNARYGVSAFDLVHDMFTANRTKVVDFCNLLIQQSAGFTWYCSSRTDRIDEGLIDLMSQAGCRGIFFGLESGSADLQEVIDKHLNLDVAADRVRQAARRGIQTTTSLILGFPEETREDTRATANLLVDLLREDLVDPQLHILTPLNGTSLEAEHRSALILGATYPDLSHSGWVQEDLDRVLIEAHPDIFVSFFSLPLAHLDRAYVQELRLFLKGLIARHRWLLVAIRQQYGDVLDLFEDWQSYFGRTMGVGLDDAGRAKLYGSIEWTQAFLAFVERWSDARGSSPTIKGVLEYSRKLDLAIREDEPDWGPIVDSIPRPYPHVRVLSLAYDIGAIMDCLRTGATPGPEVERPSFVVTRPYGSRVETLRVSPLLAYFLVAADGKRSVSDIADALPADLYPASLERAQVSTLGLKQLDRAGLLALTSSASLRDSRRMSARRSYAGH